MEDLVKSRKKNIYEVDEVLENALIYGVDEWGEVLTDEQIGEIVEKMELTLTNKLEYMGKLTINSDTFAKAIDSEIKRLQEKKKAVENGSKRTKNYIDRFIRYKYTDQETGVVDLEGLNKFKLETPSINISYRKSNAVEIDTDVKLPKKYINTVIEEKPDKKAIKEAIDSGLKVKGAKIVTNINLQIK